MTHAMKFGWATESPYTQYLTVSTKAHCQLSNIASGEDKYEFVEFCVW